LTVGFSTAELRLTIPYELPPVLLGGWWGGGGILVRLPVKSPELVSVFIKASRNLYNIFQLKISYFGVKRKPWIRVRTDLL
jgi:hypothetical protein